MDQSQKGRAKTRCGRTLCWRLWGWNATDRFPSFPMSQLFLAMKSPHSLIFQPKLEHHRVALVVSRAFRYVSVPVTYTPGDADVLVAMNPSALKVNVKQIKRNAIIITDANAFDGFGFKKGEYTTTNPFVELGLIWTCRS